jgi:hypothetical protein
MRLKENIVPISSDIIDKVNVYSFNFKNDAKKHTRYGVLAQELQEICPELVLSDSIGKLSVNYVEIIPHLINKVKNQGKTIRALWFFMIMLYLIVGAMMLQL